MPIYNFPFIRIRPQDDPYPWLSIKITNPDTGFNRITYGLIDTGADDCAIPGFYASLLGHNLEAGTQHRIRTANGETTAYSHKTNIAILNFQGEDVVTIDDIQIDFMPNLHTVLLGVENFLARFILTINYPSQKFSIQLT